MLIFKRNGEVLKGNNKIYKFNAMYNDKYIMYI